MDNGLVPTNDFGEVAEIAVVLILVVMEDGLVLLVSRMVCKIHQVLILIVVDDGLVLAVSLPDSVELTVLILVVMEDGLVRFTNYHLINKFFKS